MKSPFFYGTIVKMIFERTNMKKLATLLLISTFALGGCTSIQRALRGDDYVDSKIAAEESSKATAQAEKDLKDALTNENANFPQLSKEVAEDEAEAILHTSLGDIRIKLFPKLAPLAVENFLTHAKEGYYNGVTFHRVIDGFMVQTGDPKGDGTGGESIWHDKDKTKDKGTGFKTKFLHISIISVVLYLWPILVNQIQMVASSSSTKVQQTIHLNFLQVAILRKLSKPTKKVEIQLLMGNTPSLDK